MADLLKGEMMIKEETVKEVLKFRDDRNWKQFHNPKDMAISISLGAVILILRAVMKRLRRSWLMCLFMH